MQNLKLKFEETSVLLKHRKILYRYGGSRASKSPKINKNASRPNGLLSFNGLLTQDCRSSIAYDLCLQ